MDKGRTVIALHRGAAVFVLAVGCGAGVGGVSQHETATSAVVAATADTWTSVVSGEAPAPPNDPGGWAGGALPVVPVHGGCIIGLNCGCIRGITCPGTVHHRHPAPGNIEPHDAPTGPKGGG